MIWESDRAKARKKVDEWIAAHTGELTAEEEGEIYDLLEELENEVYAATPSCGCC